MTKHRMPTPEENPDLYDYQDCSPGNTYPQGGIDSVLPQHVKDAIAQAEQKRLRLQKPDAQ
jgi:hypothetical protein